MGGAAHEGIAKENKRLDMIGGCWQTSQQGKVGKSKQVTRNRESIVLGVSWEMASRKDTSQRQVGNLKVKWPC